jgi:uncharacterized membrane protein
MVQLIVSARVNRCICLPNTLSWRNTNAMSTKITHTKPPSLSDIRARFKPARDINKEVEESLTPLNKVALSITNHVGTMAFFLIIFVWTLCWTSYNIIATEMPNLHLRPFDPFPAFVAYLLISNVIQILLMPLIMVGQNLQSAHSEKRAENDYEINCKAEKEVELILHHLEYQNSILIAMLEKLGVSVDEAKIKLAKEGIEA